MMHLLHTYLADSLEKKIKQSQVVVWYDPRSEFSAFIQELAPKGEDLVQEVALNSSKGFLAAYRGSFIEIKFAVEPYVGKDQPEPVLIYVPGEARDRTGSLLMELEAGGVCFEPKFKQVARNVLRQKFTDGEIDELLTDRVNYEDVVAYLSNRDEAGQTSKLKAIFPEAKNAELLLATWLVSDTQDSNIEDKEAKEELGKLITSRLEYRVSTDEPLSQIRSKLARSILVNEFRSDYAGEDPPSLSLIPQAQTREGVSRIRHLTEILRKKWPKQYTRLADQVEKDLALPEIDLDPSLLGRVDTFRFEEQRLLAYCDQLAAERDFQKTKDLVDERWQSFWVEHDLQRHAQWEVCRLIAELGLSLEQVRADLSKKRETPEQWIDAYTTSKWSSLDNLSRKLESWVSRMEREPVTDRALQTVRHDYETLVHEMAKGFSSAFERAGWQTTQTAHQTEVYSRFIQPENGKKAYFLVDALRYEMGVELAERLSEAMDLHLTAAVAALPTITTVGMAALMPEASKGFSVVDRSGKVASLVNNSLVANSADRRNLIKYNKPKAQDMLLSKILQRSEKKLGQDLQETDLLVVRSQEIDALGESDNEWLASQIVDNVIGNLARAVRKLAGCGVEHFVIAADHGFLFGQRKHEDMRLDNPGGDALECHRRCWIGRGGTAAAGTLRVQGAELGYATDLDFIFPQGAGVFRTQGGLAFHHGGLSLQEMIIPVLSFRFPVKGAGKKKRTKVRISRCPEQITNRTFGIGIKMNRELLDLIEEQVLALRITLVSKGEQVGRVGMAMEADFDRTSGIVAIRPDVEASIGLMLTKDNCKEAKILIQDPETDRVLAESKNIPVQLGL